MSGAMADGMADVLIVDDDTEMASLLAELLGFDGHATRVAKDGAEGLRSLAERPADVIVLDVEMPRLTGPEMVARMRVQKGGLESIPVILCSGVLGLEQVAAEVGTNYYLAKPYAMDSLLALISRALSERNVPEATTQEVNS